MRQELTLLDRYLQELERHLSAVSEATRSDLLVSVRNEVLQEIISTGRSVDAILENLGEPGDVARRKLAELGAGGETSTGAASSRGMPSDESSAGTADGFSHAGNRSAPSSGPGPRRRRSPLRVLLMAFAGLFLLGAIATVLLVRRYSPVFSADEKTGKLTILGGLVEIDPKQGSFKAGSTYIRSDLEQKIFAGGNEFAPGTKVEFRFGAGQIRLSTAEANRFEFSCRYQGDRLTPQWRMINQMHLLDVSATEGVDCELKVPAEMEFKLTGSNGRLVVTRPRFHVEAALRNGTVEIAPDPEEIYLYRLSVANGSVDRFEHPENAPSLREKTPHRLSVDLENGKISRR